MNYSPVNEQGLLGLVTALKHGMDPSTAYSIFQNIQSDQAQQIADRSNRLQGLASLLTNAAGQGMTYQGAEALAQAQPGPMGPAVQNMLGQLYPEQNAPVPMPSMQELPSGSARSQMAFQLANNPQRYGGIGEAQSPIYTPPQPSMAEQLQMQEAQQTAAQDAAWGQIQADAAQAKAKGMTPDQFVALIAQHDPQNAAILASDPGRLKAILINTFGQIQYETAGSGLAMG